MTREEAKEAIKEAYGNSEYTDEIIKALGQEQVLNKIRAEIEDIKGGITSYYKDRPWIYQDEALAIIDKYKTETTNPTTKADELARELEQIQEKNI